MDKQLTALDVPVSTYSWDVKAKKIYEALKRGEDVLGWRLIQLPDGTIAMEKYYEGWPSDEPGFMG